MQMKAHLDLAGPPISERQIDKDGHVHWLDKGARDSGESDGTTRETMGNGPLAGKAIGLIRTIIWQNPGPKPLGLKLPRLAFRLVRDGGAAGCVPAGNVPKPWR